MAVRWSIINGDFISRGIFRLKYAEAFNSLYFYSSDICHGGTVGLRKRLT